MEEDVIVLYNQFSKNNYNIDVDKLYMVENRLYYIIYLTYEIILHLGKIKNVFEDLNLRLKRLESKRLLISDKKYNIKKPITDKIFNKNSALEFRKLSIRDRKKLTRQVENYTHSLPMRVEKNRKAVELLEIGFESDKSTIIAYIDSFIALFNQYLDKYVSRNYEFCNELIVFFVKELGIFIQNIENLLFEYDYFDLKINNEDWLNLKLKYSNILSELNIKNNIKVIKKKNIEGSSVSSKIKTNLKINKKNNLHGNNLNIKRKLHSLTNIRNYSTTKSLKKIDFNLNSPIFLELQRILTNSSLNEDTQIKIEQFLKNQGVIFLKNRINQDVDLNYYKINNYIINFLRNSIEELDKLIDNYRINIQNIVNKDKTYKVESCLILNLTNDTIISHLLGRFLRIISNHNLCNKNTKCTELAKDLASSLVFDFYNLKFKHRSNKSDTLSYFISTNYLEFQENISDIILIQIGLKLLNLLEEVGLIKSKEYVLSVDKKYLLYLADEKIFENIGKYITKLSISYKIPMIVQPKPYGRDLVTGREILGGYLLNDMEYVNSLIIKNSELKEQSYIKDENIIYDAINKLSRVGYTINIDVLEFILEKGLEYDLFLDPNQRHPYEIKKEKNKKLSLLEEKILESYLSRKQLELNIIGLALIFKNVYEFFIPVRMDNRGRIYCMADYLNYQGIELAKSLLLFSKGEKVYKYNKEAIDYLKIFGANCFGNGVNKKSYEDRVEWVNNHENDIINFRNGELIKKADSKLLFIAFCFEYNNYINSLSSNETFYITHFPIQLDATCNGYQHLSLLTGDDPLAGQLNLISGDKNTIPKDFYSFVGIKINDYLKQKLSDAKNKVLKFNNNLQSAENEEYQEIIKNIGSYERLLTLSKNRSLVKLPIMVKPYNATFITLVRYLEEGFEKIVLKEDSNLRKIFNEKEKIVYKEKATENVYLTKEDLNNFIRVMEMTIYNEFPKLLEFNNYLEQIAKICSTLNITIS